MAEEDELILRVRLDDQASASLQKMREQMKEMQGGGGRQKENEQHSKHNEHTARGINLQKQATEGLKSWTGVAKNAGVAASALYAVTGNLSVELAKMGASFVQRAGDIRAFAERMRELQNVSRAVGENAAQFKADVSVLKQAGLSAEEAEGHVRGLIAAQNDLMRINSRVRQELFMQAGAMGATGRRDMEQFMQSIQGASTPELMNRVRDQGRKIREAFEAQGQPRLGAERQRQFYEVFGAEKLDQMRKDARTVGEEEEKLYEQRIKDATAYSDAIIRLQKGLDHTADSLVALRLKFFPLSTVINSAAEQVEKLLHSLEALETFSNKPPGERLKDLRERPGGDPWQKGVMIPGKPPEELERLQREKDKALEENTKWLKELNEALKPGSVGVGPIGYQPGGDGLPPAGGSYGGLRGGGFGQMLGRGGGTSTTPISLPYGSSVGPGTGAGAGGGAGAGAGAAPVGPAGSAPYGSSVGPGTGAGAGATPAGAPGAARLGKGDDPRGLESYIRERAVAHGVDPDTAVAVAKSEGLRNPVGDRGKSHGAFQLFTGGGLGNVFQKETGLDPRDPANEKATIDFALQRAKQGGWGPWHGAKNTGISRWQGLRDGAPAAGGGAPGRAPGGLVREMTEPMAPRGAAPGQTAPGGLTTITTPSGRKLTVAAAHAANFQGFINDYEAAGGVIGPSSGGLGSRPGNPSYHPRGMAIDVNQIGYGIRSKTGVTLSREQEEAMAAKWGLYPGSRFGRRSDIGHFEVRNAAAAREALDRRRLDAAGDRQSVDVNGSGKISVDVRAPPGTSVAAEGGGLFNKTEIKRENTAMVPASTGPNYGEE